MTSLDADLAEFTARLRVRLEAGEKTYGNTSFEHPIAELIAECMEEAEDTCGWAFLAWIRLARLRDRVANVEQQTGGSDG